LRHLQCEVNGANLNRDTWSLLFYKSTFINSSIKTCVFWGLQCYVVTSTKLHI